MTTMELRCPVCLAVPGTPHSLACDNPREFERQEFDRQTREYEAGLAAAQLATARGEVDAAMANAKRAAISLMGDGVSEVQASKSVGIDRMTLRKPDHVGSPVTLNRRLVGIVRATKADDGHIVFQAVDINGALIATFPTEREARAAVVEAAE